MCLDPLHWGPLCGNPVCTNWCSSQQIIVLYGPLQHNPMTSTELLSCRESDPYCLLLPLPYGLLPPSPTTKNISASCPRALSRVVHVYCVQSAPYLEFRNKDIPWRSWTASGNAGSIENGLWTKRKIWRTTIPGPYSDTFYMCYGAAPMLVRTPKFSGSCSG